MAGEYNRGSDRGPATLSRRLAARPFVLDGATGTELERRGLACTLPLWSSHALLDAPDLLRRVHADYVRAGVDGLTAATFRTQRGVLQRAGLGERARELTALAISLARDAAAERPEVWIAGSAPPLADCYRPDLVPDAGTLAREHAAHCEALTDGGADWILVETIGTVREAAAAAAAAAATGLAFAVSFIGAAHGATLLSGEPLAEALDAIARFSPSLVAVNCVPARRVDAYLDVLSASGLPFGAYPNFGPPGPTPRSAHREAESPDGFARLALGWIDRGARLVGGCCGTRPEHLRAVCQALGRS
jgi:S-methylmethionine-dependent homocysteine/selenocysteine methylase